MKAVTIQSSMTIIICPTEKCNYSCTYCFEPSEQRHKSEMPYSFDAIKRSLYQVWRGPYNGSDISLHGGECTLVSIEEFERLLDLVYHLPWNCDDGTVKPKGVVNIVTNGSNITDRHIELFKKYNVYVGLSMDGPPELNRLRGPNPEDSSATNEYAQSLWKTMKRLRDHNIPVSIMCILHRENASTPEKLKKIGGWLVTLKKMRITGGRLNPVYSDSHPELQLSNDQIYTAWNYFYRMNKRHGLNWNPLKEMEHNLRGTKRRLSNIFQPSPCFLNKCDLFNTHTLSILPDGTIGNCDRTFAHGMYLRSRASGASGRYEALKQIECKDCRYWRICGGGCPETGGGGDWRNKTRFCDAIYRIYEYIEKKLREEDPSIALSIDVEVEEGVPILDSAHGDGPHGDEPHGDGAHGDEAHGDAPHGNLPHGDSNHGDSPDW